MGVKGTGQRSGMWAFWRGKPLHQLHSRAFLSVSEKNQSQPLHLSPVCCIPQYFKHRPPAQSDHPFLAKITQPLPLYLVTPYSFHECFSLDNCSVPDIVLGRGAIALNLKQKVSDALVGDAVLSRSVVSDSV